MSRDEIYSTLRDTFHSQSGLFLNKEQCMALCMVIYNFKQNSDVNLNKTKDYKRSQKQGKSPKGSP
tara:strand:+ start:2218 stop:2415 length:198 start_codon:yes stop_codon:yes gene_type:complete